MRLELFMMLICLTILSCKSVRKSYYLCDEDIIINFGEISNNIKISKGLQNITIYQDPIYKKYTYPCNVNVIHRGNMSNVNIAIIGSDSNHIDVVNNKYNIDTLFVCLDNGDKVEIIKKNIINDCCQIGVFFKYKDVNIYFSADETDLDWLICLLNNISFYQKEVNN